MYPDLSYILHDLFGTPVDNFTAIVKTFGLFLALSFLAGAYLLRLELKRKAAQGLFPTTIIKDDAGNLVEAYPHDRVADITMIAGISGILGAKIFAILESAGSMRSFMHDPIHSFFSGSGLAIYGGLIGGFIGVYWFISKKLKMNPLYMMDAVAPALMIGYAVGRIGCQLSGDGDWGIAAAHLPEGWFLPKWMWVQDYARNVVNDKSHDFLPMGVERIVGFEGFYNTRLNPGVYPTPIYETILAGLITAFLWFLRKRLKFAGQLFMVYLVLNGVERFFIEKIRVNDKIHAFGMHFTQAELIAVIITIIGIIGYFVLPMTQKAVNQTVIEDDLGLN
jgi:phosphatidylglycerol---prolipoprotein diacylglyceryl transferase